MVRESIQKEVDHGREGSKKGGKRQWQPLWKVLCSAVLYMSYIGNSRPASGSEHHMSHYWEMMFLLDRQPDSPSRHKGGNRNCGSYQDV